MADVDDRDSTDVEIEDEKDERCIFTVNCEDGSIPLTINLEFVYYCNRLPELQRYLYKTGEDYSEEEKQVDLETCEEDRRRRTVVQTVLLNSTGTFRFPETPFICECLPRPKEDLTSISDTVTTTVSDVNFEDLSDTDEF